MKYRTERMKMRAGSTQSHMVFLELYLNPNNIIKFHEEDIEKLQCVFVNSLKVQSGITYLHSGEKCDKSRRLKELEQAVMAVVLI